MIRRRVKITGIGPVTPAGIGRTAFWKGILEPVSRVRPFQKLGDQFGPLVAAHLSELDFREEVDLSRVPNGASRQTLFAVLGTMLALRDAGVGIDELKELRTAIVTGSSVLDFGGVIGSIDAVQKYGSRGAKPRSIYTVNSSSVCGAINEMLGITAQAMGVQSSCCSGLDAIGFAAQMVAAGEIDLAICGGVEAPLHRFPLLELRAAELTPPTDEMPERLDRPFDRWRTTGVVSEGAAMFILEAEASRRPGRSWISGYAFASDPPGELCGGMVTASHLALAEAHLRPHQIEAINAWGPGHKEVDRGEAKAMAQVFGDELENIPVVSIKGALGTPLGAAPAIQVATAALGLAAELMPPTVNWDYPDPSCPLNLSNRSRCLSHRTTLVNAHGLGGANSSMILERC